MFFRSFRSRDGKEAAKKPSGPFSRRQLDDLSWGIPILGTPHISDHIHCLVVSCVSTCLIEWFHGC